MSSAVLTHQPRNNPTELESLLDDAHAYLLKSMLALQAVKEIVKKPQTSLCQASVHLLTGIVPCPPTQAV